MVNVDEASMLALQRYSALLSTEQGKRFYFSGTEGRFWGDPDADSDEYLDIHSVTSDGAEVITTDAAGDGGGYWGTNCRVQFPIPQEWCAPHKSSNFRELYTIVRALREQASDLQGKRVLVRTDNLVSMYIIRKEASMSPDLNELVEELYEILRE